MIPRDNIKKSYNQCSIPCRDCWRLKEAMHPEKPEDPQEKRAV